MPVESNIELGSGSLYLTGVDEPIEIKDAEISCTEEFADDMKYISMKQEPIEFECTAEFARDWTLINCCRCGNHMPVTDFYALVHGRNHWICPTCELKQAIDDARKGSNKC